MTAPFTRMSPGTSLELRLARYTRLNPATGCLMWLGATTADGYATITVNRATVSVSRLVLGLTDPKIYACHTCDQPSCINREHLFGGSNSDNQRDSVIKGRHAQARKTYCRNGHAFTEINTYHHAGHRICRVCNRKAAARLKIRKAGGGR